MPALLPSIRSHQLSSQQRVTFHCLRQLGFRRAGFQRQLAVERIDVKKIPMCSRRWARSTITNLAEIICALKATGLKTLSRRQVLDHSDVVRRQIVEHPVHPGSSGCIRRVGIIADDRDGSCRLWHATPFQWRGNVDAVARVRARYRLTFAEGGTRQFDFGFVVGGRVGRRWLSNQLRSIGAACQWQYDQKECQHFDWSRHFTMLLKATPSDNQKLNPRLNESIQWAPGETAGEGSGLIPFLTISATSLWAMVSLNTTFFPSAETFVLLSRISSSCPFRVSAPAAIKTLKPEANWRALSRELTSEVTVATTSSPSCLMEKTTLVRGLSSFSFFK